MTEQEWNDATEVDAVKAPDTEPAPAPAPGHVCKPCADEMTGFAKVEDADICKPGDFCIFCGDYA